MIEDAVPVGPLNEGVPAAHPAGVTLVEVIQGDPEEPGKTLRLFPVHPNVTRSAGAAIAAPGALKAQPLTIPSLRHGNTSSRAYSVKILKVTVQVLEEII
jgi:hypothetical protein